MLLDHNIPIQLRQRLSVHAVSTARELQWDALKNGDLLMKAEEAGFEVMVTGDRNIVYQQNNLDRIISLVVVTQTRRVLLLAKHIEVLAAIFRATPGSYEVVPISRDP